MDTYMNELDFLREQAVSEDLIKGAWEFRKKYTVAADAVGRVQQPAIHFYGKETLEMAMAALLQGENLLLTGPKATGKNILAENLAYIFGRPIYNVSFHVNTNSGDLIGTDTFEDNQVKLRKGSIYRCAQHGGFGILDEINMAKNDAVSVLHATLDYRRSIDVPGYDKIDLHPAARFIGTMNYGYAGTRELNEALVSRFMVIDMPPQNEETLGFIFREMFPDAKKAAVDQFIGLFLDLQLKTANSEISTKSLDLRGLLGAVKIIKTGLSPWQAVQMGIVNKTFDIFEKDQILSHVQGLTPYFEEKLDELVAKHDCAETRRGKGFMQGIVIKGRPVGDVVKKALAKGLLVISAGSDVLRLVPPLVITKEDIDKMAEILDECME